MALQVRGTLIQHVTMASCDHPSGRKTELAQVWLDDGPCLCLPGTHTL